MGFTKREKKKCKVEINLESDKIGKREKRAKFVVH